jgi:PAS domain S-box-containing protein
VAKQIQEKFKPIILRSYVAALILLWSGCVAASLLWNLHQQKRETLEVARSSAGVAYERDVLYRRWNAEHGGVYVPVSDKTLPNPYLKTVEREILTPSGRSLTRINPAYMTRQAYEMGAELYGVSGHITSLKPIRPSNIPDPWEAQALEGFQRGMKEVSSIEEMGGQAYLRLMRPLVTEKACLKCHAEQGYKMGDIRGGISVAIPMAPLWAMEQAHNISLGIGHGLLWLLGLLGIWVGTGRLRLQMRERKRAEDRMLEANQELGHKNRELAEAIQNAERMKTKAKNAYQELNQIFNTAADGMCVIGQDYRVQRVNQTFSRVMNLTAEEIVGSRCDDVFQGDLCYSPGCPLMKVMNGEERVELTMEISRKDGTAFPCLLTATALKNPRGDIVGVVENLKDMTDQKQAELERLHSEKLKGALEMAGAVCHELNQPIQSASGFLELLLLDTTEDGPVYQKLELIEEQIERMGKITGKLMGITRYETKDYVGGMKIIDIDKSSEEILPRQDTEEDEPNRDTLKSVKTAYR